MCHTAVIQFPCNFSKCQFISSDQLLGSFNLLQDNKILNCGVGRFRKNIR